MFARRAARAAQGGMEMLTRTMLRLAGAALVAMGLAGCMDITSELELTSDTTGKATTTMTMAPEFWASMKQLRDSMGADAAAEAGPTQFCAEPTDKLTENADGSATCLSVAEGELAALGGGEGPTNDAGFEVISPGVVRVSFPTKDMTGQLLNAADQQSADMMKVYFDGHKATIRIKGRRITDTNMTLSADGTTAEFVLSFSDLFAGTLTVPDELYAVVDTN